MNTLEITSVNYLDGKLLTSYRYGDVEFKRGIQVPGEFQPVLDVSDPVVRKFQHYIALTDVVYCYDIDYFDEIIVPFNLTDDEVSYFEDTFFKGLAEFRYTNNIDLKREIKIAPSADAEAVVPIEHLKQLPQNRTLLLNGGGKDGAVAGELAKQLGLDIAWFSLTGRDMRRRVAEVSGISGYIEIERELIGVREAVKKYSGHKPMSMFVAMVSSLFAYLDNRKYIIAANEYSANFPNVVIDGQSINHQYTKSVEHEIALAKLFEQMNIPTRYCSITRPLYELQIMKLFAGYEQYHSKFLSCNQGMQDGKWCLACPKCAFVVGALYCFNRDSAELVWGKKSDVYASDGPLVTESIELINPDVKPFECIGTTEENRVLLEMLFDDVELIAEQKQRHDSYFQATSNRGAIDATTLNDSAYFPAELRDDLFEILKTELVTKG